MPENISQAEWRQGLAEPKGSPEFTKVEHVIVHHSAGPNTDTNYTNIVRNIYVFHTQSNGYDDIGYNFLIAPNGQLFRGRDGKGIVADDNTKGAHFCAKNSNTMGICMLGDYTQVPLPDSAFKTLTEVLAWKLNKEGLKTSDSSMHPKDSETAIMLSSIAFHRDACNTECPGDFIKNLEDSLRAKTNFLMQNCEPLSTQNITPNELNIQWKINAESVNILSTQKIEIIKLFNILGMNLYSANAASKEINIPTMELQKGIYLVYLEGKNFRKTLKIYIP